MAILEVANFNVLEEVSGGGVYADALGVLISKVPQQARAMSYPARNLTSEPPRSADHGVQLHPVPAWHVAA